MAGKKTLNYLDYCEEDFANGNIDNMENDDIMRLILERRYIGFYLSYDLDYDYECASEISDDIVEQITNLYPTIRYKELTDSTNGIILYKGTIKYNVIFNKINMIFNAVNEKNSGVLAKLILIPLLDNWLIEL